MSIREDNGKEIQKILDMIGPENAVIRTDHDAFDNTTLSEINIPANVAEIGEAAFSNCSFSYTGFS